VKEESMFLRIINHKVKALAAGLALLGLTAISASPALAGCLDYKGQKTVGWQASGEFGMAGLVKVSVQQDGWSWEPPLRRAPIVGLWAFKYISKGNYATFGFKDGMILDGGNTLFYADGNENTVSGVRNPETGNVCLGVWERTGEWTYELNHIGLSWDPVKNLPAGPAFIKQKLTLGKDLNSYTGTFSIRQLDPDGKTLSTPAPIVGTIVATRVNIDTDTQESLP
jgi:hypothetical protein